MHEANLKVNFYEVLTEMEPQIIFLSRPLSFCTNLTKVSEEKLHIHLKSHTEGKGTR